MTQKTTQWTPEPFDAAMADVQLLRLSYAAAQREIESLQERDAARHHDYCTVLKVIASLQEQVAGQCDEIGALHEHADALEAQLDAVGAGGVEPLRKRECLHQIAEPPVVDGATLAGLIASECHLSALVDQMRALLVEVEDVCGRDDRGFEFEDGESEIIDKVRAMIAMTNAAPQPPVPVPAVIWQEPTGDMIRAIARNVRTNPSDDAGPHEYVVAGWKAAIRHAVLQPQATPVRPPLTNERIANIVREAAKNSAIRRDGLTGHRIARAVEAAHGIAGKP